MKLKLFLLFTLFALAASWASAQKYAGGDISLLPDYIKAGSTYFEHEGTPISSPLEYFRNQGMNAMRVRLFVNPKQYTGTDKDSNASQDLEYVTDLAKQIKSAGMKFMLDFHYSDTWADPGKQWTPAAWAALSDEELGKKLYEYTCSVLLHLNANGVSPDFIQTGNEISYGMLWGAYTTDLNSPDLKICYPSSSEAGWTRFAMLLKQAVKACRDIVPEAKIIIHTERVSANTGLQKDNEGYAALTNFYTNMSDNGIDYDIIGLSYYPYFHGALSELEGAINVLGSYDKDIMIVETGYPYAWSVPGTQYNYTSVYPYSDEGQASFTRDLIKMLNAHSRVTGLFWWWMEYNAKGSNLSGWYNAPLFDSRTGRATSALPLLKDFISSSTGISSPAQSATFEHPAQWYDLQGRRITNPSNSGVYINKRRKVVVK